MRVPAPAKINLHLRVGPRQPDGFHPLLTWMTTIGLFDTLTLVRRRSDSNDSASRSGSTGLTSSRLKSTSSRFTLAACNDPALPLDGSNLVTRAAQALLADAFSQVGEGLTDNIERVAPTIENVGAASAFLIKRIPRGAGLGGGSSDAASTLIGLNRLWELNLPLERLRTVAAKLGSDVPFFLYGGAGGLSCVCSGRGEHVREIDRPAIHWATLITPPFEIATADVYRRFDELGLGSGWGFDSAIEDQPDWVAWTKCSAKELMPQLINDLEPAAFSLRPELGELRQTLEETLGRVVRMSGSGSSLFVLCDSADEARSHAEKVKTTMKEMGAIDVEIAPARVSDPRSAI